MFVPVTNLKHNQTMNNSEYQSTLNRINELEKLQNTTTHSFDDVNIAWELNDSLKAARIYEDLHYPTKLAKAEANAEWHAFWKAAPMGLDEEE